MKTDAFLDVLCEALNRDPGTLTLADTPETVEEWDSVGHLSIVATVDGELGVSADEAEMQSFGSIGDLVTALKARGALED